MVANLLVVSGTVWITMVTCLGLVVNILSLYILPSDKEKVDEEGLEGHQGTSTRKHGIKTPEDANGTIQQRQITENIFH